MIRFCPQCGGRISQPSAHDADGFHRARGGGRMRTEHGCHERIRRFDAETGERLGGVPASPPSLYACPLGDVGHALPRAALPR